MRVLLWWTLNRQMRMIILTSKLRRDTSRPPMITMPTNINNRKQQQFKTLFLLTSRMALLRVSFKEWKSRKSRKCKSKEIKNLDKKVISKGSKSTLVLKGWLILKLMTVLLQSNLLRTFKRSILIATTNHIHKKRILNQILWRRS